MKVRLADGRVLDFSDKLECRACEVPYEDPFPNLFSFNSPQGACPDCHGFGDLAVLDEDKIIPDKSRTLEDGAIEPWTKPVSRGMMKEMLREARKRKIPTNIPFKNLKEERPALPVRGRRRLDRDQGLLRVAPVQEIQGPGPRLPQPLPEVRLLPGLRPDSA